MTAGDDPADGVARDYDRLAEAYAAQLGDELDAKPLDRALLATLVEQTAHFGGIADLGCGPGHVAGHLVRLGAQVHGVDISPGMIAVARRREPAATFSVGDLRELTLADDACGGLVAFYCLVHLRDADRRRALAEMHRIVVPGGFALVGFHIGDETIRPGRLWDIPVELGFRLLPIATVVDELVEVGFEIDAQIERRPYDREHPTQRGYVVARRPC